MGNDEEATKLAFLIVAAWFLNELAKKGGNIQVYRCWRCDGMIKPHQKHCPWCGASQDWGVLG